jgi:endonuclease-3
MPSRRRKTASKPRAKPRPTRQRAAKILDILESAHPEAKCALTHRNPFELTVATILSAQCTDERVNQVTPALFRRFPRASALAEAEQLQLEELIRPTGFFRSKARSLTGCARALVERHGGRIPKSHQAMTKLPGVGRKTANVVLGHAYGIAEGIAVDTHVRRVSTRLGLAQGATPEQIEVELMGLIPQQRWTRTSDLLIFHGRKICGSRRPSCGDCPVFHLCRWEARQAHAVPAPPRKPSRPRPRKPR